jgi:tRNA nucleotidyltransferase/poly(A) polymerase
VQQIAVSTSTNIYLTGGAVRDLISGMPIHDLDFTVEGNPLRIVREFEKSGAGIVEENEALRHVELLLPGDVDGSVAAARDEVYERPGTKPEIRWATIMEDLRRRDFSLNAIAISLNPASRGLLLDPTNGLADLEKREVRALSIHSFTNQPIRLLRITRYCARMGFKMEARTAEWFALALERGLDKSLDGEEVGNEVGQLAREERPVAILKAWEAHGLIGAIHPQLSRRRPDYDGLASLTKVREAIVGAGYRPQLLPPVAYYLLARLKQRERSTALHRMELAWKELERIVNLEREALKVLKLLKGRQTAEPLQAYHFLHQIPLDVLAFIQSQYRVPRVSAKIRNFLYKWKPLRISLPVAELESLGVPHGPKFDKILEDLFELQLAGKGRAPQERTKLLRKLAGIKPPPKKKVKVRKKRERREGEAPVLREKVAAGPAAATRDLPRPSPAQPLPPAPAEAITAVKAAQKPAGKRLKKPTAKQAEVSPKRPKGAAPVAQPARGKRR